MDWASTRTVHARGTFPLLAELFLMAPGDLHAGVSAVERVGKGEEVDTRRRALIVEDEFLTSWHLSEMMADIGFRVVGVSATGEDAVRLAEETEPDVILMDVNLKGTLDGVEAAQAIRDIRSVPIVFVSAYTDTATVRRMETVEGAGRVAKPVTSTSLRTVIEAVFEAD